MSGSQPEDGDSIPLVRSNGEGGCMKWRIVRDMEAKTVVKKGFAFLPIYDAAVDAYIWFEPYYFKRTYYYQTFLCESFLSGTISKRKQRECVKDEFVTKKEYVEYLKSPTKPWKRWKIERIK